MAILVYSAMIWSKEWSTKGSFIYRLLMLPGSRFSVYLSKLLTMLIITFFLQGVQVIGVFLNYTLSKLFIPESGFLSCDTVVSCDEFHCYADGCSEICDSIFLLLPIWDSGYRNHLPNHLISGGS